VYLIWKILHVIGVVLFLGNIITGVFWAYHADRARDPRIIAHAFEGISRSDRWFTMPGVILLTVAGLAAAMSGGFPILRTGWIFWGLVLLILSGLTFMFFVAPLQRKISALAHAGSTGQFDSARYDSLRRSWALWGSIATLAPLAAVVLMVLKPILPAL
jgi:uncharacterized membrane protein